MIMRKSEEKRSLLASDDLQSQRSKRISLALLGNHTTVDEGAIEEKKEEEQKEDQQSHQVSGKWIQMTEDTVTAVTASNNFIAWSSQDKAHKYAVFIASFDGKNEIHGKPMEFETGGLVQGLDFNSSSNATQLVCAEFNGMIYLYAVQPPNSQTFKLVTNFKVGSNNHLTSISFQRPHESGWVAVGSDSNDVRLFRCYEEKSKTFIAPAHGVVPGTTDKLEMIIKRKGKVLDVEFLWEQETPEFIVADGSGMICIYSMTGHHDTATGYAIDHTFSQEYDLSNMECGCMLSSADTGNRFVVACGDRQARVLQRIPLSQSNIKSSSRKDFVVSGPLHDTWEELIAFPQSCFIMSVNMSGDGNRVAVAL